MVNEASILNARVLIVDDQEDNAHSLCEILRFSGYANVNFITDATGVCDLHEKNRYHLILLDLRMPGMDGFEVMKRLQAIDAEDYLPVLAVTGEPTLKLRALKGGAKDFISKPFDPDEVLTRVHNMLEVRLLHEEVRKANSTLEILALHDPLTGLANRRLLTDRISASMANARRNGQAMAVLCLDLDGFKQVNDTLGHDAGDTLLQLIAGLLGAEVRQEDTAARVGGDEFVVALWNAGSPRDVETVASKLIEAVARPHRIGSHVVKVTTSVGVAVFPEHGVDAATLLKSADDALYAAKSAGKNAFRFARSHL